MMVGFGLFAHNGRASSTRARSGRGGQQRREHRHHRDPQAHLHRVHGLRHGHGDAHRPVARPQGARRGEQVGLGEREARDRHLRRRGALRGLALHAARWSTLISNSTAVREAAMFPLRIMGIATPMIAVAMILSEGLFGAGNTKFVAARAGRAHLRGAAAGLLAARSQGRHGPARRVDGRVPLRVPRGCRHGRQVRRRQLEEESNCRRERIEQEDGKPRKKRTNLPVFPSSCPLALCFLSSTMTTTDRRSIATS